MKYSELYVQPRFSLGKSLTSVIKKSFVFYDRARRSEYWWFFIAVHFFQFVFIIGLFAIEYQSFSATGYLFSYMQNPAYKILAVTELLFIVASFFPSLAVTVRRLHDIGKSGWNVLWVLVPLVGWVVFLCWMCQDSDMSSNRFGESPKYISKYSTNNASSANTGIALFIYFFFLLCLIGYITFQWFHIKEYSYSPYTIESNNEYQPPMILHGTIGKNIPFTMYLQKSGEVIEGTEHYDNQKTSAVISIIGWINDDGEMILTEFDNNTKAGKFEGYLYEDSYSGTFTNSKGVKYKFKSKVSTTQSSNKKYGSSETLSGSNRKSHLETFKDRMEKCTLKLHSSGNFLYPSFMKYSPFSYTIENDIFNVDIYSWDSVQLAYWPVYDLSTDLISKDVMVETVTYQSDDLGIYSGYTSDERIFYLKIVPVGDEIENNYSLLALIYPKDFKDYMQGNTLTEVVEYWNNR